MLVAVTAFSAMNLTIKFLPGMPPMELVFFRCLISLLICIYWLRREGISWRGSNRILLVARGASGTLALFFFFAALQNLPLATAVTISYTSPLFSTLFALIFLREKVHPLQWAGFAVSLSGVFLLKGWDPRISWLFFTFGILSAVFSGIAYNLVRSLKEREHPLVVVLHFQIVGALAGLVFSAPVFAIPRGWEWLSLLMLGLFTQLGQVNLTKALQHERVGVVTSINFLAVIYAGVFGWVFFSENLPPKSLLAMTLVAVGVILNIWVGGSRKDTATPPVQR